MTTIDEKREQLAAQLRELIAKLPLPVRLAWRIYCRLNRRRWQRLERARFELRMEQLRKAVSVIRREAGQ